MIHPSRKAWHGGVWVHTGKKNPGGLGGLMGTAWEAASVFGYFMPPSPASLFLSHLPA